MSIKWRFLLILVVTALPMLQCLPTFKYRFTLVEPSARICHGHLGFWVQSQMGGLRVIDILEVFPAWQKGIRPGDLITTINGRPVASYTFWGIVDSILTGEVGSAITLTVRPSGSITRYEKEGLRKNDYGMMEWTGSVQYVALPMPMNEYQDECVRIYLFPCFENILFAIQNKTGKIMRILWDRCTYIDPWGKLHKVIHKGAKFMRKEEAQLPTIVPAHETVEDLIYPWDHVWGGGRGVELPLLPKNHTAEALDGSELGLFLTIQQNDTIKQYNFRFAINTIPE